MLTSLMEIKLLKMKKLFISLLVVVFTISCNNKMQLAITRDFIDAGPHYSKAVSVTNGNIATIYVAGLTGDGADFETQTRSTYENIRIVLEKAGAGFKDLVKMNIYIPDYTPGNMDIFRRIRKEVLGETNMPASTVIGVAKLAATDKLIEIEAVAVIQKRK